MSSIPTPPNPAAVAWCEHPPWCDPKWCESIPAEINHASTPQNWRTSDSDIDIMLRRTHERAFPDEPGGTSIQFFIKNWVLVSEGEQVYLTPAEARVLGCRLIGAAALAEQVTR
jgi:hypothetical protein